MQPVWWDAASNGGFGSWRPEQCHLMEAFSGGTVTFTCHRLGYYSYQLLKESLRGPNLGAPTFRFHHPLVYVGGTAGLALLLASSAAWAASFGRVRAARPLKHALVNVWLGAAGLVFVFCAGAHQVEHGPTCRAVGLAAHALTLCDLAWLAVGVHVVLQMASRHKEARSGGNRHGSLFARERKQETKKYPSSLRSTAPVARLYLLGWGSGAAVTLACFAADPDSYGLAEGSDHCFMRATPFLAGVVLPGSVLTALLVGFAMSAWCVASSPPSHVTEQVKKKKKKPNFRLCN